LTLHSLIIPDIKKLTIPGVEAHTSNPSFLGSRDQENFGSRPAGAKMLVRVHLNEKAGHGGVYLSSQLHRRYKIGV
jgi:hypothetical protein